MRRRATYGVVLLVATLFAACDSNDDGPTEAELFVGTWTLTRVEDAAGDKTSLVSQQGTLTVQLAADGTYVLRFDRPTDPDQESTNTYALDEVDDVLTLQADNPLSGGTFPVAVTYAFQGEDEVVLTIRPEYALLINAALGGAFGEIQGTVRLTIRRV
jgi:hypothetical protein